MNMGYTRSKIIAPAARLGQIYVTTGADNALFTSGQSENEFLNRHMLGDWGDLAEEDRIVNGDGTGWCMSRYHTRKGEELWIITEYDHSVTTVLLPSEY
jgi:hypothetical protein